MPVSVGASLLRGVLLLKRGIVMQKRKHVTIVAGSLLALSLLLTQVSAWEAKGFKTPESVQTDPSTGYIYVSNINGAPAAKDDNGFISRLNPDGSIEKLKFIDGANKSFTLDAPKGTAIYGDFLYVTDITHVRAFKLKDGTNAANIDLTSLGASFLNDITADEKGNLYVSDTEANAIFLIKTSAGNEGRVLLKHEGLRGPNGLMLHPQTGDIIVASLGGVILKITSEGIEQLDAAGPFKNLDGIDYDSKGNIYFSDFTAGVVYKLKQGGKAVPIAQGLKSPADISVDRKKDILLIPEFSSDRVKSLPIQ